MNDFEKLIELKDVTEDWASDIDYKKWDVYFNGYYLGGLEKKAENTFITFIGIYAVKKQEWSRILEDISGDEYKDIDSFKKELSNKLENVYLLFKTN